MTILVTGVSTGLGNSMMKLSIENNAIYGVSRTPIEPNVFSYHKLSEIPCPDVLILNAAMGDSGFNFLNFNSSEFCEIVQTNMLRPISFFTEMNTLGKLDKLKELIIIGSRFSSLSYCNEQSFTDLPGYGYCVSKAGLSVFVNLLRKDSVSFSVNIIHPGIMKTQLGSETGYDASEVASKLIQKINSGFFSNELMGIYDLMNDEIIPY